MLTFSDTGLWILGGAHWALEFREVILSQKWRKFRTGSKLTCLKVKHICDSYGAISTILSSYLEHLLLQYQPSGVGGTHSPPATSQRLQNLKWPPWGPQWPTGSTPWFLGVLSNFCWIIFFWSKHFFYEKRSQQREKNGRKKGGKWEEWWK